MENTIIYSPPCLSYSLKSMTDFTAFGNANTQTMVDENIYHN